MMHAKIMTVDGYAAMIGSSNFNRRSLDHDEEVVLAALDEDFVATLDEHFDDDLTRSERIDGERWANRSVPQRALETATKPIRRWM